MSDGMTHEQATEELEALALDALDAFERGAVLAHVVGCDACKAELVVLQQTAAHLASVVAPVPMSPAQRERLRARLLARAAADHGTSAGTPTPRVAHVVPIGTAPSAVASRRRMNGSGWLTLAASIVAIVSIGALVQMKRWATAGRDEGFEHEIRAAGLGASDEKGVPVARPPVGGPTVGRHMQNLSVLFHLSLLARRHCG